MLLRSTGVAAVLMLGLGLAGSSPAQQVKGFQAKVAVSAPTRLDWTFALTNRSLEQPLPEWKLAGYDSAKQQYDLFVPPNYNPKQSCPVVLFISPGDGPGGWREWEPVCKKQGIIFASPHGAGNNTPVPKRVRLVLDVLDDLRRDYNTDPERTYISGFSGGGRIAAAIAYALPEHFGGVVPVCAGGEIRNEDWLQRRLIERLNVALVTGENDFNRGEVERYMGTWLAEIGVRSKVWMVPKLGHAIPGSTTFAEVYRWLEEGASKRRELAKRFPATSIPGQAGPSREERAGAMLAEGKARLQAKDTTLSGLLVLLGCAIRFEGLPAAGEAKQLCLEYDGKADKFWVEEQANYERRFTLGRARGLDAYASGPLPAQYAKMRSDMAKAALNLYDRLLQDGVDARAVDTARKRIPEMKKLLEK